MAPCMLTAIHPPKNRPASPLPGKMPIVDLGTRQLKGLDGHVRVFNVETKDGPDLAPSANGVAAKGYALCLLACLGNLSCQPGHFGHCSTRHLRSGN